jgi:hypothetical protein
MAARFYQFLGQNSRLINLVESKYFTIIMLIVIVSNTFVMIFETYDFYYQKYNSFFLLTEKIYLCIYIIECSLKLWVDKNDYFLEDNSISFRFILGDIFKVYGIVLIYL